jgi:hypothetical protein
MQGFLLFTLFCSWFTYPLVFGVSHPMLFKVLIISLLGISLLLNVLSSDSVRNLQFLIQSKLLPFIIFYIIYLICYTIATFLQFDERSVVALISSYTKVTFAILLLLILSWHLNIAAFKLYAYFIFILTIVAILLFILITSGSMTPLGSITIPRGVGDTVLENYGLGFSWHSFEIGGYRISRLQSFADEPGSFAHGLLPALYWAFFNQKKIMIIILFLGLLLTFSVGAILAMVVMGGFLAYKKGLGSFLKIIVLIFLITTIVNFIAPEELIHGVDLYLKTKYDVTGMNITSGGERLDDTKITWQLLLNNPWGYGADQGNKAAQKNIAVGWWVVLIESGFLGGIAYFIAFSWLFVLAVIIFLKENDKIILIVCSSYISSYIMSAQRAKIDASFWLLWLVVSILLVEVYHKENNIIMKL